ncbi:3'(2'),5'-bisphosphate nucleotidase CysQ [Roseibium sp.]|uniref:3'(2'),5'-bisphosphate nucleotidase CysQ n=1 Tax=Roseibium sp. TaxID=1936156 RepID=UPI003A97D68A
MPGNDPGERPAGTDEDLLLLERCAREAGDIAMGFYGRDPKTWFKDNNSPVSEADLTVDRFLADCLLEARPDYGWLSEETADSQERLNRKRTFIVDPIDGTRAFLAGGEEWTIVIAVVEAGRPVSAVVYCPVRAEMFTARAGLGAFLNDRQITVSTVSSLHGASLTGPHSIAANKDVLAAGLRRTENIRSLAYRIALVALGSVDVAAARAHAHDWDLAAADLLVQEAGGRLTDFSGKGVFYNKTETRHPALVAAATPIVEPVCALMSKAVG